MFYQAHIAFSLAYLSLARIRRDEVDCKPCGRFFLENATLLQLYCNYSHQVLSVNSCNISGQKSALALVAMIWSARLKNSSPKQLDLTCATVRNPKLEQHNPAHAGRDSK